MAVRINILHCETPNFSFETENEVEEWKSFYIQVIDFIEAMDINIDTAGESK